MQLVLTGASGFIGTRLSVRLLQAGHSLVLLTHGVPTNASTPGKRLVHWTPGSMGEWAKVVDCADGVINLAGESIAGRKWTYNQQFRLQQSCYHATQNLVLACQRAKQKPKFLINALAVGYYYLARMNSSPRMRRRAMIFSPIFAWVGKRKGSAQSPSVCAWSGCAPASSWVPVAAHW